MVVFFLLTTTFRFCQYRISNFVKIFSDLRLQDDVTIYLSLQNPLQLMWQSHKYQNIFRLTGAFSAFAAAESSGGPP